jgi:hypothetical protein
MTNQTNLSLITIVLVNPPKVSLNEWYAGSHWSERKKLKDSYEWLIYAACKNEKYTKPCYVEYNFKWGKTRALDPSNCVAMIKLIEDCLFPKDSPEIIKKMTIISQKDKTQKRDDIVEVSIFNL